VGIPNKYKLLSGKDYKLKYFKIFEKEKMFIPLQKCEENWEIRPLRTRSFRVVNSQLSSFFYVQWTVHRIIYGNIYPKDTTAYSLFKSVNY